MKGSVNSQTAKTCNKSLTGQEWGTYILVFSLILWKFPWLGYIKSSAEADLRENYKKNMLFDMLW